MVENIFDLKGSSINREVKMDLKIKNTSTLKDENLKNICKDKLVYFYYSFFSS